VKPEERLASEVSVIEESGEEADVKKLEMILIAAILRRTP
jgi:hypothetical protein